ncbi:MAG TPA: hypothetical protein PKD24_15570 [Pyrinomonadaceae bacterium]|nr:hypothetical protein [Pyrinomonadaceae bacterium]HMP66281.1 hypothetical protein [Pyrinomonadaceae bacterium]
MSKKYHLRRREFLNLEPSLRAYIIAAVEDEREKNAGAKKDDKDNFVDISLRIADCYNEISLYFDLNTADERENSLYKIRTLAEVICEFKRAIELEIEVINAREAIPRHERVSAAVH